VFFLARMEKPGDRDIVSALQTIVAVPIAWFKPKARKKKEASGLPSWRIPLLPQIVDTYVLSNFLFYFVVILATFVFMFLIFNFFDLTGDMIRNKISLRTMFTYLFFLAPYGIYDVAPICVLVAVLANLGVLSKQNEVTAFKACGISLCSPRHADFAGSAFLLSGALFAFDYYYLPAANRRQDKLRDQIKGKPTQTYYRADRKWTLGKDFRIYYYAYFDPSKNEMADANVYELQPSTFQVVKQIRADRAHWNPSIHTWVFEDGWLNDIRNGTDRTDFQAKAFPELTETPEYFLQEYHLDTQMNFRELEEIHQGVAAKRLRLRHGEVGDSALPQIRRSAFRADHGDDRRAFRFSGGQSRGAHRYRRQHRHRAFLSGDVEVIRESGRDQRTHAGYRGVGAGCDFRPGRVVLPAAHEELKNVRHRAVESRLSADKVSIGSVLTDRADQPCQTELSSWPYSCVPGPPRRRAATRKHCSTTCRQWKRYRCTPRRWPKRRPMSP
jgi:lipopolysaccharide export LptBFGC system permease protein LptF